MSLLLLSTEVGRGHPFYLDGLEHALRARGVPLTRTDVFSSSSGAARLGWQAVRASYLVAGRGGALARAYEAFRARQSFESGSPLVRLLGRGVARAAGAASLVVVDHPILVGALRGHPAVWLMHGELVAPGSCVVRTAARVLVPLEETAEAFRRGGTSPDRLAVTGLCIERPLAEECSRHAAARRERIVGSGPLTVGLFSSGAEPRPHVAALAAAARSARAAGHRVLAFARAGGRLAAAVPPGAERATFHDRASLDAVTAERFGDLDVVVSPAHERSNWAVGLRVPFALVGPDIGPFSPLNRALLLREGVALELPDPRSAEAFAATLARARASGALARILDAPPLGPLDGFARAATLVHEGLGGPG